MPGGGRGWAATPTGNPTGNARTVVTVRRGATPGVRNTVRSSSAHRSPALAHRKVDLLDRAPQRDPHLSLEYVERVRNLRVVVPGDLLCAGYPNLRYSEAGSRRVLSNAIVG